MTIRQTKDQRSTPSPLIPSVESFFPCSKTIRQFYTYNDNHLFPYDARWTEANKFSHARGVVWRASKGYYKTRGIILQKCVYPAIVIPLHSCIINWTNVNRNLRHSEMCTAEKIFVFVSSLFFYSFIISFFPFHPLIICYVFQCEILIKDNVILSYDLSRWWLSKISFLDCKFRKSNSDFNLRENILQILSVVIRVINKFVNFLKV